MSETQEFRHILVIEDRKGRRIVSLEDSNYTLGRDSNNPIVIYDYQVSRTHGTLIRKVDDETGGYSYRIIDGDLQGKRSTNGLLINGHSRISHELKHGDSIRFANEAKANYYIIATGSGIDLFNPDDLGNMNSARSTLTNSTTQTLISKEEENHQGNAEDQEELIRLASFPELSPNPIIELDWEGNITYLNPAASIKFETIQDDKLAHPILAGLLSEYNNRQGNLFLREVKIGTEVFEQYVHYLSEKKLIRSYIFDFTKRKQVEAQLRESEGRYRAIIRQTSEGIILAYGNNKRIIEVNDTYCRMVGYTSAELQQFTLYNIIATDLQKLNQDLANITDTKQDYVTQYLHRCKNGSLLNLECNISINSYQNKEIFCIVLKKTSALDQETEYSIYDNFHDVLTNLPNEKLFREQLSIALANAKRYQYLMSLIVVEIQNLADFRDIRGEEETGQFIRNFAQTFQSCLRAGDLAARWNDNTFIALFSRIRGPRDPAKIAKRMSNVLEQYLQEQRGNIDLKLTIGMVVYPLDGDDTDTLIKNTLNSLEEGRGATPQGYGLTGFTISPKTASLLKLENLIGSAIQEQQFFLCYQPQVNADDQKLQGLEALLRWNHPELGKVTPQHFLRLAEETDFMLPLGIWILQTVTAQMQKWHEEGLPKLTIGVNISGRQFNQSNFPEIVERVLEQTGLPPQQLELEINEACLWQNPEFTTRTMSRLSQLNVGLCLDNFGVGNSSLGYLQQYPFRTVKISPSIITKMDQHSLRENTLVRALVTFAQGYNLRVVAVGVEKLEQVDLLRDFGCGQIQGNLFSRPLPTQEIMDFLKQDNHSLI